MNDRTNRRRRNSLLVGIAAVGVLLAADDAAAQATCDLPLAAYLTDAAGVPLTGTVDLLLTFYDGAGGDAVAVDCREVAASVEDGWLRTTLDACGAPDDACGVLPLRDVLETGLESGRIVSVGITVDGADTELSPRIDIGAAPYAIYAASADEAAFADRAGEADGLAGFDPATPLDDVECADGEILLRAAGEWTCAPPPESGTSFESTGPTLVAPAGTLELLGDGAPRQIAQAWQVGAAAIAPLVFADGPYACVECGDGSEGAFEVPPLTPTATMNSGIRQFTTVEIPFGTTIDVTGDEPLIIRATEWVVIDGTLDLNADGWQGGPGGDDSSSSSGFGGGGGGRRTGWLPEWNTDVTTIEGGGAGTKLDAIVPSDIGGGGGGGVAIVAPRIVVRGTITADGGDGASGGTRGGGGAGGSIWLRGTHVEMTGTFSLEGGIGRYDGQDGVPRIDAHSREGFDEFTYNTGVTSDLPLPLHIWQTPDGTIRLVNNGPDDMEVILSGD